MTLFLSTLPADLKTAAQILLDGGVVALPTETVYGLTALASSDAAIEKIYAAKNRPPLTPLTLHVANIKMAESVAMFDEQAKKLAAAFWPGPLTMILPPKEPLQISKIATAGVENIGVRMPNHPLFMAVQNDVGAPLVSSSANLSGEVALTNPTDVFKIFQGKIDAVVEGGVSTLGIASTILDLSADAPRLLREGSLSFDTIKKVL
ncbi:MAG: L-threonylcarbamoyladenylate synthase [Alphaproteobacteria bacterium]